jgi:hypothetical protein
MLWGLDCAGGFAASAICFERDFANGTPFGWAWEDSDHRLA